MSGICGQIPFASLEKSPQGGYYLKTSQLSLLTNTFVPYSEILPRAGLLRDGKLFRQLKLELPISAIGSGLWGTPNTLDGMPSRSYDAMKRQATTGGRKNRSRPGNLREQIDPLMCQAYKDASREANRFWRTPDTCQGGEMSPEMSDYVADNKLCRPSGGHQTLRLQDQVKNPKFWPTPTTQEIEHTDMDISETGRRMTLDGNDSHSMCLADKVKWPTSTTRDWKGARKPETLKAKGRDERNSLPDAIEYQNGGQLNPDWVAWLMGWPIGWEALQPFEWGNWPSDDWWRVDPADNEVPYKYSSPCESDASGVWQSEKAISNGWMPRLSQQAGQRPIVGKSYTGAFGSPGHGTIPRVATGIPNRVDRLKALGNGQVPLCVKVAWEILSK